MPSPKFTLANEYQKYTKAGNVRDSVRNELILQVRQGMRPQHCVLIRSKNRLERVQTPSYDLLRCFLAVDEDDFVSPSQDIRLFEQDGAENL